MVLAVLTEQTLSQHILVLRKGGFSYATGKEIKAKTETKRHSSPSYLQGRLRGRILLEKVKISGQT